MSEIFDESNITDQVLEILASSNSDQDSPVMAEQYPLLAADIEVAKAAGEQLVATMLETPPHPSYRWIGNVHRANPYSPSCCKHTYS